MSSFASLDLLDDFVIKCKAWRAFYCFQLYRSTNVVFLDYYNIT